MIKLLVDMNLSPDWVALLQGAGWDAVHWSSVGDPRAPDAVIMAWARGNRAVVFTHDLDFGALLALTGAEAPSVIQVRTEDVTPQAIGNLVLGALRQFESLLDEGAIITVDEGTQRARVLPLRR